MSGFMWPHRPHPRGIGTLVDHQVWSWGLNEELQFTAPAPMPVVTISHESGEQGLALGRRVALRLGFACCDDEIIKELARLLHTTEANITAFEERKYWIAEKPRRPDGLSIHRVLSADYADHLRRIVDSIVRRGKTVIVGRDAQFMVDSCAALRVRLVTPLDDRVRQVAAREEISLKAAKHAIQHRDRACAALVLHATGKNVADPAQYDLVLNTTSCVGGGGEALVVMGYLAKFGDLPIASDLGRDEEPPPSCSRLIPANG